VHTWWEAGLELLSLVRVLEAERVEEPLAPDLELDLVGLFVPLNYGSCVAKK
jgi:hypothetical protein